MKISVFGLGYVGTVITACFAKSGHEVVGVDTDATKVALINQGKSPIVEKDLEPMLGEGVAAGRIRATTDSALAVMQTDMSMVCVGTPSRSTGDLDLVYVARVCENIGAVLKAKPGYHLVVVRSTMLPGSVHGTVVPALERSSGKKCGAGFGVAINPEFLRESTAVHDFYHPPKTVVGSDAEKDADIVASLYTGLPGPLIKTAVKTAEMVKYVDNVFHALKVTYANEIGSLCKEMGVDAREVMSIFCQDQKLNLSPAYLKPGFAYGGSCLPKDLRALTRLAHARDVEVPLLNSISVSNEHQIKNAVQLVTGKGKRKIGVLGFAFKGGTDDLRESPVVTVVEALLGKGYDIRLFDSYVSIARLVGANRKYIEQHIPHLSRLMVETTAEIIAHAEVLIIGNQSGEAAEVLAALRSDQFVIDLRPASGSLITPAQYERICS